MDLNDVKKFDLKKYVRDRYDIKCDNSGKALCPFHDDKKPSLSFFQTKAGFWRFKCFGCDKSGSIIDFKMALENLDKKEACRELLDEFKGKSIPKMVGIKPLSKLDKGKEKTAPKKEKKKIRHKIEYDYKDRDGKIAYRKVKFIYFDGSKDLFFKHEVEGKPGLWDWTKGKADHVPYNLDKFKGHDDVLICEGEKDANTVTRLKIGLLATTAPTGDASWPDVITQYFKDFKKATFLYDVGAEKHVKKHATTLKKAYPKMHVGIASVPMDKKGSDITDYLVTQEGEKSKQMALLDVLDKSKVLVKKKEAPDIEIIHMALDKVDPRPVEWLWPNRIPLGKLTLLCGDPGTGKSYLSIWMASHVTTGAPWPDLPLEKITKGVVLAMTAEDGLADTVRIRAGLMGADLKRLIMLEGVRTSKNENEFIDLTRHLPVVESFIKKQNDLRLVIIDVITDYLGAIKLGDPVATRTALIPLAKLAEKYNFALLGITHMNKDEAKRAIYRVTGSISYVAVARAAWLVSRDEDDPDRRRRFLTPLKMNLAPDPDSLAFSVSDRGVTFEDAPAATTASEQLADKETQDEYSQFKYAEEFLSTMLKGEPMLATDIIKEAKNVGIGERTLKKVKSRLSIESLKKGHIWYWGFPLDLYQSGIK
ncbi:DNA primase [subsurface metagenome]